MKKLFKQGLVSAAVAGMAIASISAHAATATQNFNATASIAATCVVAATNVDFGAITPAATGTAAATGTITSTCTNQTAYTLSISKGAGVDFANRSMAGTTGNTDKLKYNLFTEVAATSIWGDGTTGTSTGTATGNGAAQVKTIYGQLPLNQYLKADSYSDSLVVTLSY